MCSTVVLPAPFGPSSPVTPGCTSSVTSFTATTFPYHFDTDRNDMTELPDSIANRSFDSAAIAASAGPTVSTRYHTIGTATWNSATCSDRSDGST